jgi:hypothetical protein
VVVTQNRSARQKGGRFCIAGAAALIRYVEKNVSEYDGSRSTDCWTI